MAARRCTGCGHVDRPALDEAMTLEPTRNAAIAERFGLSRDAVRRHREHLSPALKAAITRREKVGPRKALDRLEELYDSARAILEAATADGKPTMALGAIKELRGIVETLAKVTGELDESPRVQVVNLQTSPEWQQIRAVLVSALAPFPEAAQVVSGRLLELER